MTYSHADQVRVRLCWDAPIALRYIVGQVHAMRQTATLFPELAA